MAHAVMSRKYPNDAESKTGSQAGQLLHRETAVMETQRRCAQQSSVDESSELQPMACKFEPTAELVAF